ncbi:MULTISPECIES: hypothetical protein [unclassified Moraxella]|uniref:hypothetical protein n=1 Tax=unclassified Moraxella TaxID=2685852 RepID=UPI003AF7607D
MQKMKLNPVKGSLSDGLMMATIEILLLAVHDLPDLEKRLLKAKERVLFNQISNHPEVKKTIEKAHKIAVEQATRHKLNAQEQDNG